jgi:GT2 family glycosyltransferase
MTGTVPVAVIIPTYNRGTAIFAVLERIAACDPAPAEILVHIDSGDGILDRDLKRRFPKVQILSSARRLGPGGGRHRCLLACTAPYVVSFDDDSYPVDVDFFARVERLFSELPRAAVLAASIWHRNEPEIVKTDSVVACSNYVGSGHAMRLAAYREVRGYLPQPLAYGMEESDLSLQLFAAGWSIYRAGEIRVFHDTELKHHHSPEVTAAMIANVGLYVFLHYPLVGWGWGLLQLANKVADCVQRRRYRGISRGILRIPTECYRHRRHRNPIDWQTLRKYFELRKLGAA